ncbi:hypothetical protein P7K49_034405 [Saguinus oedipus]|uniref:Interferon regulatory factor 7 n=1 Tax=Saguinus oedipus TaxID=9490 RepID=A0ABQ9TUN7_SAGOE|nr:hypothetical protein P7K49_034405 [Saguinus oedipus]
MQMEGGAGINLPLPLPQPCPTREPHPTQTPIEVILGEQEDVPQRPVLHPSRLLWEAPPSAAAPALAAPGLAPGAARAGPRTALAPRCPTLGPPHGARRLALPGTRRFHRPAQSNALPGDPGCNRPPVTLDARLRDLRLLRGHVDGGAAPPRGPALAAPGLQPRQN